jgi:GntR family transcriptional regulator
VTGEAGPEYQRLMRLVRARIISGEYPVGGAIPSTTELVAETGKSRPVVRQAIAQLQAEGILEGHQGKGVFVAEMPAVADHRRADTEALGEEFAEFRREVRKLADQVGSDDLRARVGELEARMGRMEAIVVNLTQRSGLPNPFGGERDQAGKTARRGRAG